LKPGRRKISIWAIVKKYFWWTDFGGRSKQIVDMFIVWFLKFFFYQLLQLDYLVFIRVAEG
jgi:hypothetical protein